MNKEIRDVAVFVTALLIVFAIIIGVYLKNCIEGYKEDISHLESEYSKLEEENVKLQSEYENLELNIYNAMEKKPYEISIEHDGEHITYKQSTFGIFGDRTRMSTRTLGMSFE